jgi:DNA-binding transcriptional ArsR family regulator
VSSRYRSTRVPGPQGLDGERVLGYFPYWIINYYGKQIAVPIAIDDDRLNDTFAALANSTRRAILAHLANGAATVNELAEPFSLTLPAVSKHIKVLERAGLVVRGQTAQYRPCALNAAPLEAISSWTEQYRRVWEARFDQMDAYLVSLRDKDKDAPQR